MKVLATDRRLFREVAAFRYIVSIDSFSRVPTKLCSVLHVLSRNNRFAGGKLFTVNNLPPVRCNLYHPSS